MNNPGRPKGTIKTVKYMNPDELDRFLLTAKKIGMKENFMFTLMYDLALRIGELKQITLEDINQDAKQIHIRALKGGITKWESVTDKTWRKYLKWMKVRRKLRNPESPYLFPHRFFSSSPITHDGISFLFQKVCKRAGLKRKFSCHSLRHSLAMTLVRKKENAVTISQELRHRAISSSQEYFAMDEAELGAERARAIKEAIIK